MRMAVFLYLSNNGVMNDFHKVKKLISHITRSDLPPPHLSGFAHF